MNICKVGDDRWRSTYGYIVVVGKKYRVTHKSGMTHKVSSLVEGEAMLMAMDGGGTKKEVLDRYRVIKRQFK